MGIQTVGREERGSIVIFVAIMFVATALVFATLLVVEQGLRTSRRSGDSANALQVADAGINDAVKSAATVAGTSFSRSGSVGNGSYSYTATLDGNDSSVWHIDAVGTDQTGVKRHLMADAKGQAVFAAPMFINSGLNASSGTILDSYHSGYSAAGQSGSYTDGGCTGLGNMFFSTAASQNVSFGSSGQGTSVNNCEAPSGRNSSWQYVIDGCVVYDNGTMPASNIAQGKCPPAPFTRSTPDPAPNDTVGAPAAWDIGNSIGSGTFTCNSSTASSSSTATSGGLRAGKTYYFATFNLQNGCGIDPSTIGSGPGDTTVDPSWVAAHPVKIFASTVSLNTGTQNSVNAPPITSFPNLCGAGTTPALWTYQDINKNPAFYYCTGWVQSIQTFVIGNGNGNLTLSGNSGRYWGTFRAPTASVSITSPNMEFWGAIVAGNMTSASQFTWHYDDTLSAITTGKFTVKNWREEPLS